MSDEHSISIDGVTRIRFGGVGGQGVQLAGKLLGKAAALFDGKEAVCTQAYGPEARGGASRSDVIVSDEAVDYPFVNEADVLAVMFHEAYARFRPMLRPGGLLIVDTGLVKPAGDDQNVCGLAATRIADELGSRLATNIVMLGYLVGRTGVVSRQSIEEAIRSTVPKTFVDLDLKALDAGISLGRDDLAA